MPLPKISRPQVIPENGEHLMRLSFKVIPPDPLAKFNPDQERWCFTFTGGGSDGKKINDETGELERVSFYTGTAYGNEKSALTKMLDNLIPGCNNEIAARTDPSDMDGKWFFVMIKAVPKDGGGMKASYVRITPYKKTSNPTDLGRIVTGTVVPSGETVKDNGDSPF